MGGRVGGAQGGDGEWWVASALIQVHREEVLSLLYVLGRGSDDGLEEFQGIASVLLGNEMGFSFIHSTSI